jgi:Mn2+/Fe2+ NRAMP family transporter
MSSGEPMDAPTHWRGIIRHLGPGLIITACIVGSGELIMTPIVGWKYGFDLLWFIALGCVIKVFVQVELGRFAVTHGMTTLEAMDSIPGPRLVVSWLVWAWLVMFCCIIFQIAGIIGAVGQVFDPLQWSFLDARAIAIVLAAICGVLLFIGRYRMIEIFAMVLVLLFTICTIMMAMGLQWTEFRITGEEIKQGLSFKLPGSFTTAFAALGIIGVGASELIYYPYWCLEKGYARNVGPRDDSAAWFARAQGWMKIMRTDAFVSMVIYTSATIAFFLLGAAVLPEVREFPSSMQDAKDTIIPELSKMYTTFKWGLPVFTVGAFAVLFSTMLVGIASNGRLLTNAFALFKLVKYKSDEHRARMVKYCCVGLTVVPTTVFLVAGKDPAMLVMIGAVAQATMLPLLASAALYFRYKRTEPQLRPGAAWTFLLWLSAVALFSAGIYQLATILIKHFALGN